MRAVHLRGALGSGAGHRREARAEQREANAGKTTRIEIIQAGRIAPVKLDGPSVEHYVNARIAMAKLWHRDPAMYQRVHIAVQNARTMREFSEALTAERPVAELLALYQYTPETFVAMELTLLRSEERAQGGFDMTTLSDVEKENHAWMARHLAWLSYRRGSIAKAEEGMTIWR